MFHFGVLVSTLFPLCSHFGVLVPILIGVFVSGELEEPNVEIPQGVSKDFQRFAHRLALQIRELRHLRDEAEANGNLALAADYTAQINQLNPFDGNFGSNALPVLQAPGVEATEEPEPQPGVQGDPADVEPVCKQDGMHNTM